MDLLQHEFVEVHIESEEVEGMAVSGIVGSGAIVFDGISFLSEQIRRHVHRSNGLIGSEKALYDISCGSPETK